MTPRVLVVEDEADVRELMVLHLKREGYWVDWAESGEQALLRVKETKYSLVVLDWMLPSLSGLEICRHLTDLEVPILMVTARADATDIVRGLEAGADDYVTKPFEKAVFIARVKALIRRTSKEQPGIEDTMRVGELEIRVPEHSVVCNGQKADLTISEFKLLVALVSHQGRVLSRAKLIELVQGEGVSVIDRTIDTHMVGLRKKLGPCAGMIETIRGVGYRILSKA